MVKIKHVPVNPEHEFRYILILAAIQFAHMVDFVVLMPLGPTLMEDLNIGPVQFGSLVSSYNFAGAAAGILFGFFADKFDRKKLLLASLAGFLVGTLLCGLAPSFSTLLAARMLTGVFGGILNGLIFAIISDLVPFERRGKAMGIVMSSFSVASVLGVPLGLAIADYSNWHNTFLFIVFFTLFIFIASALIFPNLTEHLEENEPSFKLKLGQIFTNFSYIRSFVFIALVSGAMFLLIPFLSPYAVKNMGIATDQLKYMYLVGGLFTILTARLFGTLTDKIGPFKMFAIIVLISFIPIILFTHSGPISFGIYLCLGTFFMTMVSGRMIPCMTLVSEVPELRERGLFMSVLHSIRSFGSGTMTFVSGFIISEGATGKLKGFNYAGYLSVALGLATVFIAFYISKSLKEKLRVDAAI